MRKEEGLHFISPRHEESAAHMADGWATISGDVGVCVSTVGPGAVNQAAGIAEAYADSIPVLAITANVQSFLGYPSVGALEDMDTLVFLPADNEVERSGAAIAEGWPSWCRGRSGKPGVAGRARCISTFPSMSSASRARSWTCLSQRHTGRSGRPRGDVEAIERAVRLLERRETALGRRRGGRGFRGLGRVPGSGRSPDVPATTSADGCRAASRRTPRLFRGQRLAGR